MNASMRPSGERAGEVAEGRGRVDGTENGLGERVDQRVEVVFGWGAEVIEAELEDVGERELGVREGCEGGDVGGEDRDDEGHGWGDFSEREAVGGNEGHGTQLAEGSAESRAGSRARAGVARTRDLVRRAGSRSATWKPALRAEGLR